MSDGIKQLEAAVAEFHAKRAAAEAALENFARVYQEQSARVNELFGVVAALIQERNRTGKPIPTH